MKLLILSSAIGAACAFSPSATSATVSSLLYSTPNNDEIETIPEAADVSGTNEDRVTYSILSNPEPVSSASFQVGATTVAAVDPINGWVPDANLPCYGLPGSLPPTGFFDPLGFSRAGITLNEVKRYREAEVQHGRVAMMAFVGYLAGEAFSGPFGITGPANDQLQQVPLPAFILLTIGIATAELKRATIGWVEPDLSQWTKTLFALRENYYPGDLGFDPLGLKPDNPKAFANMQTRELQNGRLAMIGVAGLCSQELVNHKTVMATIDFYQKVYSGIDPYA